MQRRYTVFWMLLQRNFLVLIAVEAIENDNMQATKFKELVPSFYGWVDYGDGRGGEGMVRSGQINRILN